MLSAAMERICRGETTLVLSTQCDRIARTLCKQALQGEENGEAVQTRTMPGPVSKRCEAVASLRQAVFLTGRQRVSLPVSQDARDLRFPVPLSNLP